MPLTVARGLQLRRLDLNDVWVRKEWIVGEGGVERAIVLTIKTEDGDGRHGRALDVIAARPAPPTPV